MRPTVQKVARFLVFHPDVFVNDPAYQLGTLRHAPEMSEVIWSVKRAFAKGIAPINCEEGTSRTFILRDEEEMPIAVFKRDSYMREFAAYRLDHKRFANVPPTVLTTLSHPVFGGVATGSCQLFIQDTISAVELERKLFDGLTPTSVRRMAQIDIRLLNEDRHTSNILIRDTKETIPIDHGYILTNELGQMNYVWVFWNQTATPFSEEEQTYISWLDPEKDRALLIEELGLPEKVANRQYLSTMLLKLGVIHGFYPNQIGDIVSKTPSGNTTGSKFELLIKQLRKRNATNWTLFTKYVNEEIEAIFEKYETDQHTDFTIPG